MRKKVLLVDLDGTLYSINTFHAFIKYLILHCIKRLDVLLLIKISVVIFSRALKLVSHSKMKYVILKAIKNNTQIDYHKFVNSMSSAKRNISLIKDSDFDIKILATAAPICYAMNIAKNEGFDICLGTDFPSTKFNDDYENCKEVKKNNVMNYLKDHNSFEIDVLISDHIDDLPLMKLSIKNLIVNPNHNLKTELKKQNISYEIVL